jgi:probable rRNA maturation factor
MKYHIDLQIASTCNQLPDRFSLQRWVNEALDGRIETAELSLRIVDEAESQALNKQYRDKDKPTNVLSFPCELPDEVKAETPLLGDMVICAPVLLQEAAEQSKPIEAHWAHIVIHGCLHLLGYDHIDDHDAQVMENLERECLQHLGHPDPYGDEYAT